VTVVVKDGVGGGGVKNLGFKHARLFFKRHDGRVKPHTLWWRREKLKVKGSYGQGGIKNFFL